MGYGMLELQPFCMEVEPFGGLSVEGITNDGGIQTVLVCGMYPELVSAACLRIEGDAGVFRILQQFVTGDGRLAMFEIDFL